MSDSGVIGGVRQRNLARILRLVHLDGPLSRATLTELTGLNRSTIADLVGELTEIGLAEERAPGPAARAGRPSPLVAAHPDVVAIAANPEVDAVELAAVGLDHRVVVRERIELDQVPSASAVADLVAEAIRRWQQDELAGSRVVAVGLAVPGLVRGSDGLVRDAPHLRWRDQPVRDLVAAATGLPTVIGNDATHGAIAEHLYGAARGIDDVVYLNGGASGIGGGLIVHGMPVLGAGGYSGEFGQNRPGIDADADRRARGGVLEDEVSRARLLEAVGLAAADERTLAEALEAASDVPAVAGEVDRQQRILATALANAVNVLNPRIVVLGGFLAVLAEHDADAFAAAVAGQAMSASAEGLVIRPAALGADRILIGAAEAAFGPLLTDPVAASGLVTVG